MRFPQLPVGQRFRWKGVTYIKSGPMTAEPECGGGARMIPRSAEIEPANAAAAAPAAPTPAPLTPAAVRVAVEALAAEVAALADALPPEAAERLRTAIADGRQRCLERLGL